MSGWTVLIIGIFMTIWTLRMLPFINVDMAIRLQMMMKDWEQSLKRWERDLETEKRQRKKP